MAREPDDEPIDLRSDDRSGKSPAPSPREEPAAADAERSWLDAHDRRCGFSVGLLGGAMVGSAEGFPNDSLKIDRLTYFTETGAAGGGQGAGWLGVALVDWLVFGVEGHGGRTHSSDHLTTFFGGGLHLDAFPLYALGGQWQELGVSFSAGVATSKTVASAAPDVGLIESGGASRVGAGAFYEGIRLWKLSMGPFASYDQIWSQSAWRPTAWLGWRTAFYLGPR